MAEKRRGTSEYLQHLVFRSLIRIALILPYRARVAFMGWVVSSPIAPIAGWRRRIRANLDLIWPDLPQAKVNSLTRKVPDNFGRALIESFSGNQFIERVANLDLTGPGVGALERPQLH